MDPAFLRRAAEIAAEYLASLPERPVRADASLDELRGALRVVLDDASQPALQVIEELAAAADPGLVGTQSPRYFGFVIGGGLDAATAADWLTSVWDQNGGGYPVGPSASVAEEVACRCRLGCRGRRSVRRAADSRAGRRPGARHGLRRAADARAGQSSRRARGGR